MENRSMTVLLVKSAALALALGWSATASAVGPDGDDPGPPPPFTLERAVWAASAPFPELVEGIDYVVTFNGLTVAMSGNNWFCEQGIFCTSAAFDCMYTIPGAKCVVCLDTLGHRDNYCVPSPGFTCVVVLPQGTVCGTVQNGNCNGAGLCVGLVLDPTTTCVRYPC